MVPYIRCMTSRIRSEYDSLKGRSTKELREMVLASERVFDATEMNKWDCLFHILRGRYGQRALVAAGLVK